MWIFVIVAIVFNLFKVRYEVSLSSLNITNHSLTQVIIEALRVRTIEGIQYTQPHGNLLQVLHKSLQV